MTARRVVLPAALAGLALLGAGCDLTSQGAGTTVHVAPVVPEAVTLETPDVEILDAYISPGGAGSPIRLAATLSNQSLHTEVLVRLSASTGADSVHLTMPSGTPLVLPDGIVLGRSRTALTRGRWLRVTFTFTGAPAVRLRVPVGGTPALSSGS